MIEYIVSTTIEACIDSSDNNPFVGGWKIVVEIIVIAKNMLDLGKVRFEEVES